MTLGQSHFLAWSKTSAKLYRIPLAGGAAWEEFPVQPSMTGTPARMCCATPDGRIALSSSAAMYHWDPATETWETIAHPGFVADIWEASAAGSGGDMVAVGNGYQFTYTAATKTWAKIGGPSPSNTVIAAAAVDDVWVAMYVATTAYLYHWDGASWSANLFPTLVAALGFWPHTIRQICAVSADTVYFTTYAGATAPWGDYYAQIIGWNGVGFAALHSLDDLPAPGGDTYPDRAPHAVDGGIWYDDGTIYTIGCHNTVSDAAVCAFASTFWSMQNTPWAETLGSCFGPLAVSGGAICAYGYDTGPHLHVRPAGSAWSEPTFGGADVGQVGLQWTDITPPVMPEIENESPQDASVGVDRYAWIEFDAMDGDGAIVDASTVISIAGEIVVSGGVASVGYFRVATTITGGLHYALYRSDPWPELVEVSATITDASGGTDTSAWSFSVAPASVALPPSENVGVGELFEMDGPSGLEVPALLEEETAEIVSAIGILDSEEAMAVLTYTSATGEVSTIAIDPTLPWTIQSVTLDDVEYLLELSWSPRCSRWYLGLKTAAGEDIVSGVAVVVDYPLLSRFGDSRLPPGRLIAVSNG